jgi:hypothetical protein
MKMFISIGLFILGGLVAALFAVNPLHAFLIGMAVGCINIIINVDG